MRIVVSLYAFSVCAALLLVAPWTRAWDNAVHTLLPESVHGLVLSGWIRGCVSGVGILDLVIAVQMGNELWRRMGDDANRRDGRA